MASNTTKTECADPRIRNNEYNNKNGLQNGAKTTQHTYLNFGEVDQMEIFGYKYSKLRTAVTWTAYVLTFGLLRLVYHWYPKWELQSTHTACRLEDAEKVLIVDIYKSKYQTYFVKTVSRIGPTTSTTDFDNNDLRKPKLGLLNVRFCDGTQQLERLTLVRCKKLLYAWNPQRERFMKIQGLEGATKNDLHDHKGFTVEEQQRQRITYGRNEIRVPVAGIWKLLAIEMLTPFYVFQVFSIVVWLCEVYYYYCLAIVIMSVFGIGSSIIQTRKNQQNLHSTVHSQDTIRVSRGGGAFEDIPTTELVPGDVIEVPLEGCVMHCDAVLLKGHCIVNESMLTGESVPVTKTALPHTDDRYSPKHDASHTLFCGTRVIQTKNYGSNKVVAVVIRTGYLTAKGQLVRSILYPPPADFKFDQDSYKFIMILAVIGISCFVYTIVSKSVRGLTPLDILIKGLDVITIAIPPALPAAMTVGKLYALVRLKNRRVFCMNSRVINVSGSVNCVCFDKTGTLTEDGLDLRGVIPIENGAVGDTVKDVRSLPADSSLVTGMACCHSLTLIGGDLVGDPLDVKMFESTGWTLEEPNVSDHDHLVSACVRPERDPTLKTAIVHQYQFSSSLQRMSVITRAVSGGATTLFCKGSPEMVISLCAPRTVPPEIQAKLDEFTEKGYRVIGLAVKELEPVRDFGKIDRSALENGLTLTGFLLMENRLKPVSAGVIRELREANIKTVMITGDNIKTAISVAKESCFLNSSERIVHLQGLQMGMEGFKIFSTELAPVKHGSVREAFDVEAGMLDYRYAMDGHTWSAIKNHNPYLLPEVIKNGVVFARMSGEMKQELIEELQLCGHYVAMCGDGANDCGALKAAHVGISLSEAESSVASPFTAKDPDISCVPLVIREGRAALTTSFGVFKFMLCYSLTELASVMILYSIDSNLTSVQFLFIDVCLVLVFASVFGNTRAHAGKLCRRPPLDSLLSFLPLASVLLHMGIVVGFQLGAYFLVRTYPWFVPFEYDYAQPLAYACSENYVVFALSTFQYVASAVVFSKGRPHREPLYTNRWLCFCLALMTVVCAYLAVFPAKWVLGFFEMVVPAYYDVRVAVLGLALGNLAAALVAEEVVVEYVLHSWVWARLRRGRAGGRCVDNPGFDFDGVGDRSTKM